MDWGLLFGILLPAVLVLLSGFLWQRFPPKKINYLYGYRTQRSMRNQQTWDYANRIGPVMFIKTGIYLMIVDILAYWFMETNTAIFFSVVAMVVGLIVGVIACEMKLAQHFDEKGNPKP